MTRRELLQQLSRSGPEGDLDAFRGVAKQVIVEERQKRHLLANDLKTILYGRASGERPTTIGFRRHEVIHGVVDRTRIRLLPEHGQDRDGGRSFACSNRLVGACSQGPSQ